MTEGALTLTEAQSRPARAGHTIAKIAGMDHRARQARYRWREILVSSNGFESMQIQDQRKAQKPRKRNKLFYKNRWLLARHLVLALQRAGVDCNIIVPDHEMQSQSPESRQHLN